MERTIVVPETGTNTNDLAGILSLACQNKGLNPAEVMAMCGNRGGFGDGWGLDGIIALIVVAAIFGGNGFGGGLFGNRNGGAGVAESQMIMDAIQRNGIDISQLASTLNCSVGNVQNAIQSVGTQICNLAASTNQNSANIISSLQQGNMSLIQQICTCCCDLKSLILGQTNSLQNDINFVNRSVERGFADLGYATRDQTCAIEKSIEANTSRILEGQRAAELREMQRDLTAKDNKITEMASALNNCHQSQMFSQMLTQAVTPLVAGQLALQKEVNDIVCKLPETKTIQCPTQYVPVNYDINVPLTVGRTGCGCGYGYNYYNGLYNGNFGGSFF